MERQSASYNPINAWILCMKRCVCFSGRACRTEYWLWNLSSTIVSYALAAVDMAIFGSYTVSWLAWTYCLIQLLPGVAVFVRRMHDIGRSGWNILWYVIPVAMYILWIGLRWMDITTAFFFFCAMVVCSLVPFVFCCLPGTGPNKYGSAPATPEE